MVVEMPTTRFNPRSHSAPMVAERPICTLLCIDAALWQLHYVRYGLVAEPTMVVSTGDGVYYDGLYLWFIMVVMIADYQHMNGEPA